MDALAILKQSFDSFHKGSFSQCKSSALGLQSVVLKENKNLLHWVAENNCLAADFHLTLTIRSDLGKFPLQFNALLKKVQSLPPQADCMELELTVLYNCLQSALIGNAVIDSKQWETCYKCTVHGVAETCGLEVQRNCSRVWNLLQELYADRHIVIPAQLASTCLLWELSKARSSKGEINVDTLSLISQPTSYRVQSDRLSSQRQLTCRQAVMICQSSPPLSVTETCDMCVTFHAACKLSEGKLSEAGELASKVTSSKCLPICVYIKAMSEYRSGLDKEAVVTLQTLSSEQVKCSPPSLQARLRCLSGCCLANLDKPHTAIQHFKSALDIDFSYLLPLYYVSEQYRQLQMGTAQLEALNLLATAIENYPDLGSKKPCSLEDMVLAVTLEKSDRDQRLTTVEVQSLLALTCLNENRYEDAYERYMDLLALTMESQVIQPQGEVIYIPSICEIFLGAITASLKSQRLDECITLCDQALSSQSDKPPLPEHCADTQVLTGEKRKRTASVKDNQSVQTDYTSQYMVFKADALQKQGKLQDAINTLENAVERLGKQSSLLQLSQDTDSKADRQQPEKRRRLGSGTDLPTDLITPSGPSVYLGKIYSRLGQLSSGLGKPHQAIHYLRCSLLMDTDNLNTVYWLSRELVSAGRVQEAVTGWLDARGISVRMDRFQLSREIQNRENLLKNIKPNEQDQTPSEVEMTAQDVSALKSLLKHRQTKVWKVS